MWPVPTVHRRYMVIIRTCPHTIFSSLSDNNLAITQCCCSSKFLFPCFVSRVVKESANLSMRTVGTGHIGQLDTLSRPYVLLIIVIIH